MAFFAVDLLRSVDSFSNLVLLGTIGIHVYKETGTNRYRDEDRRKHGYRDRHGHRDRHVGTKTIRRTHSQKV